jgi:hypothetical protein
MSSTLVLIGDLLIAPLLAAVVYYSMRLHRRLETLRAEQKQLGELIAQFSSAANRADAATAHLKTAGLDTDKSVRASIARAESMRDELAFLIDRADQAASARVGEARPAAAAPKRAPSPPEENEQASSPPVRSEAERELIHAMRQANGGR